MTFTVRLRRSISVSPEACRASTAITELVMRNGLTTEAIVLSLGYPFERKGVDLVVIGHLLPQRLQASGLKHAQITALPGMPHSARPVPPVR